jgi:putative FmdB family regulatory protein
MVDASYNVNAMPIYEFRCASCNAKVAIFFRSMTTDATGTCEHCGSADLRRLFSSFRVMKPSFDVNNVNKRELLDGVNYTDPRSMANFFNKMQDTFQDEPNEHMSEMVQRLENGEAVESAMDLNMGSNYTGGDDHAGHNHGPLPSADGD